MRGFSERLRNEASVEGVYWLHTPEGVAVWTVLPDVDLAAQDAIYAAELATIGEFRSVPLDFKTVFRGDRTVASVVPSQAVLAFSRA